jgi:DNA-binding NarL/FixJ family response regulator
MRVVVADTQADVRSAVQLLVTHDLGLRVVGEVAGAADLCPRLLEVRPDLLLLDWELLGVGADVGMARLRALYPGMQVVVLSGHPEARRHALAAGADAFVSKADSPEQMIKTLHAVCARDDAGSADNSTLEENNHE